MGSLTSYTNASITQALLPTRGVRFQGADDARVHDFVPGRSATSLQSRAANTQIAQAYPQTTPQASPQPTTGGATYGSGTIPGGALRPGSIDQTQFKAMLNAASAGVPGSPTGMLPGAPSAGLLPLSPNAALTAQTLQPGHANSFSELSANAAAGAGNSVQTLSPAQFAALTGGVNLPAGALPANAAPGNNLAAGNQAQNFPANVPGTPLQGMAPLPPNAVLDADGAAPQGVSTPGVSTPGAPISATSSQVASTPAASAPVVDVPVPGNRQAVPNDLTMTDASIPADGSDPLPAGAASATGASPSSDPGDESALIGKTDKNGVLVLNQIPDRETRKEYAAKGIKWRIVDDPASDRLFFGPDGKFGWDDVVDLINPLQHIPLVNIAYRHFTGDEQNGSAELLGGIAMGPVSALTAIADLAVRSATGKDIGENVIAMITGDHGTGDPTLAQANSAATKAAAQSQANAAGATGTDEKAVASVDSPIVREHDNGRG